MTKAFDDADEYDRMLHQGLKLTGEDKLYYVIGRLKMLESILPPTFEPTSVVDFGCGSGGTAERLQDMFPSARVIGYDPARGAIVEATERFGGCRLGFTDDLDSLGRGSIDLCYSNGAIHHIAPGDRAAVFARLFAMCRPGGRVALFENNPWNPGTRLVMRRIPFDREASPLPAGALARGLRNAGFSIDCVRHLFVFPAFLRPFRRAERWLTKLPIGAQYVVLASRP